MGEQHAGEDQVGVDDFQRQVEGVGAEEARAVVGDAFRGGGDEGGGGVDAEDPGRADRRPDQLGAEARPAAEVDRDPGAGRDRVSRNWRVDLAKAAATRASRRAARSESPKV
jgi:hypothetical protein